MEQRRRSHVVLVDDETAFTSTLAKILERQGFVASPVGSAVEALDLLQLVEPDAIVLDVRMPGLSGVDALPRIRAVRPRVPVILLTGHMSKEEAEQAIKAGTFDVLHKPCDPDVLVHRIWDAVDSSRIQSLCAVDVMLPIDRCLIVSPEWTVGQTLRALGQINDTNTTPIIINEDGMIAIWDESLFLSIIASKKISDILNLSIKSVIKKPFVIKKEVDFIQISKFLAKYSTIAVSHSGSILGIISQKIFQNALVNIFQKY